MSASNFNLSIPFKVMVLLKQEAKRSHISVNELVLKMMELQLGLVSKKHTYHDLDHLAGSWSGREEQVFKENTHFFEQEEKI